MLIRAKVILPMSGTPISDGAVRVRGSKIEEVGAWESLREGFDDETMDLGESILLPGLINAHCHLDYSTMRNAIAPPAGFTEWVQRLNSIKRQLSTEDILEAIQRGYAEAQRYGTTTICSMAAFPDLVPTLPPASIRTWWFYEMIDIRHRLTSDELVAGALSFFEGQTSGLIQYGLNPHAPYTASLLLYRLAQVCAQQNGMLLTTHVSESVEESEMFETASGPLYKFLESLGRPMDDCGMDTPFGWLWRNGALGKDWLLAHLNDLRESDFQLLESLPPGHAPHVVHCPGSHAYFKHPRFPFGRLAKLGANICIGTDSLASTDSLSLLGELRKLRENEPDLNADALLSLITLAPARALKQEGVLGCISRGATADLIAIPKRSGDSDPSNECIEYQGQIPWMMVDGKLLGTGAN